MIDEYMPYIANKVARIYSSILLRRCNYFSILFYVTLALKSAAGSKYLYTDLISLADNLESERTQEEIFSVVDEVARYAEIKLQIIVDPTYFLEVKHA